MSDATDSSSESEKLLGWTSKQGRILTARGRAEALYCSENGYPFKQKDLPHYHLIHDTSHEAFHRWRMEAREEDDFCGENSIRFSVTGAWTRLLFSGGFEHTSESTERVFNIQTPSLFVDLRIPIDRPSKWSVDPQSVDDIHTFLSALTPFELRLFARQHCFSGYSRIESTICPHIHPPIQAPYCTRHHNIDWNFVGTPRNRPNKWRIEMDPTSEHGDIWNEWSYATDEFNQHYYIERWQRMQNITPDGKTPMLALRTVRGSSRDKVIVLVGNHFAFARARLVDPLEVFKQRCPNLDESEYPKSLVDAIDYFISNNMRAEAQMLLTVEGGYGQVQRDGKWKVLTATHPCQEGRDLAEFSAKGDIQFRGEESCGAVGVHIIFGGDEWVVMESCFPSVGDVVTFLSMAVSPLSRL